jgi:hypothetical protein
LNRGQNSAELPQSASASNVQAYRVAAFCASSTPVFIAVTPNGKIPAIVDHDDAGPLLALGFRPPAS